MTVALALAALAALPNFAEIGPDEYRPLRRELRSYYPDECHEPMRDPAITNSFMTMYGEVEAWSKAHPGYDALDVRRESYRAIRRHFRPVLYREFLYWGEKAAATPDGRYAGDRFSQGLAPSEYRCKAGITDVINALGSLDHAKLAASNANLMFDGTDLTPENLGAVFRVFALKGAHMLQPNCVSVETLLDAQVHPERHMDIIVKVCGFSARFVALSPRWQREVIERHRLR